MGKFKEAAPMNCCLAVEIAGQCRVENCGEKISESGKKRGGLLTGLLPEKNTYQSPLSHRKGRKMQAGRNLKKEV